MTGLARAELALAGAASWRVGVPMVATDKRGHDCPWTANMRIHWTKRRTWTARIRSDVAWLLKAEKVPPQEHVTAQLHYRPGDNRRRDPSNLMPTQKAAVDAMVTARIVIDDAPQWVTELMPVIHPGKGERALWLEITAGRPEVCGG